MIESNSYTVDDSSRDEVLTTVTRRFPIVRFLIEPKFLTGLGKYTRSLVLVQKSRPWNIATKGTGTNEQ
jgi:hypothetical protein